MPYNSTIIINKKVCLGCNEPQFIFSHGRCQSCSRKTYAPIKKVSDKRMAEIKDTNSIITPSKTYITNTVLQRWFDDRHTEMTGVCRHCLGKTTKGTDKYKFSIAHILPKAYFKSVATHPLNWIELCFFGKSCHTNFDNYMLDITELNCFDTVIQRFIAMYPSIDQKEKRRIPAVLMNYIDINKYQNKVNILKQKIKTT